MIPSRSTGGQASAGETAALVKTIRREHVPAVFAESSVRSDVEDAIAREAGAKVAPALWADSLGPKGSSGATYIASMEANTHTIAAALGGDLGAPTVGSTTPTPPRGCLAAQGGTRRKGPVPPALFPSGVHRPASTIQARGTARAMEPTI